ncbi:MAG: hypothetical protein GXO87_00305 [Chlorobi bacterium]|nr:hypothetical protein [Chlorobiota bacterium]
MENWNFEHNKSYFGSIDLNFSFILKLIFKISLPLCNKKAIRAACNKKQLVPIYPDAFCRGVFYRGTGGKAGYIRTL